MIQQGLSAAKAVGKRCPVGQDPELKLTDRGLVDAVAFRMVPLFLGGSLEDD